jgi:diacylglycerol kinase family enzyme
MQPSDIRYLHRRLVNIDGEVAGKDAFDIEVLPGALQILVSKAIADSVR